MVIAICVYSVRADIVDACRWDQRMDGRLSQLTRMRSDHESAWMYTIESNDDGMHSYVQPTFKSTNEDYICEWTRFVEGDS